MLASSFCLATVRLRSASASRAAFSLRRRCPYARSRSEPTMGKQRGLRGGARRQERGTRGRGVDGDAPRPPCAGTPPCSSWASPSPSSPSARASSLSASWAKVDIFARRPSNGGGRARTNGVRFHSRLAYAQRGRGWYGWGSGCNLRRVGRRLTWVVWLGFRLQSAAGGAAADVRGTSGVPAATLGRYVATIQDLTTVLL